MPPKTAGTPSMSWSYRLITTRTLGNSASRSARATCRKYLNNTAPPRIFDRLRAAPECLAGVGRRIAVRPGRNHHHHVVEHLDLERALAQATPDRNIDRLLVAAAAEHADVAILLDRSLELDSHQSVLGKGPSDFVMRDLDEIGLGEHTDHLLAQPAIVRLEILLRSAGPRIDLGVEVKIGLTQQIELFEILIVKQGAELAGKLPETSPARHRRGGPRPRGRRSNPTSAAE